MHAIKYTLSRVRVCDRAKVAFMLRGIYRAKSKEKAGSFRSKFVGRKF